MFLHWEKPGRRQSAPDGWGAQRGRRNPNKTCSSGLSNGKLIMPQCPDKLSDRVSHQRPSNCLPLTHRATCHKDHSGSWQQTLKMSESKRVLGRCHWGRGEPLWCLQYKQNKQEAAWKISPYDSQDGNYLKEEKRTEKGRAKKKVRPLFIHSGSIHFTVFRLLTVPC